MWFLLAMARKGECAPRPSWERPSLFRTEELSFREFWGTSKVTRLA